MMHRYNAIITDQQAEGSPQSHEEREPVSPKQTMVVPPLRPSAMSTSPLAETGMLPAVVLPGEGAEDSNTQDATRTTAEIRTAPVLEPALNTKGEVSALIVEDTFELAEILQITLQRMHIQTAHESHGSRAFARFNEMHPDVILLDIGLPDGPGWNVLESIKQRHHETGEKMPAIIVITAYDDPANRLVGKLHGVYSYLIKPFTPHEVERIVRSALISLAG